MKLHEYQEKAIKFCLEEPQAYLALDLGLGKTVVMLHVIDRLKQPAFVFAPLNVVYNTWPDEIAKWTPHLTYKIIHGLKKSLIDADQYDILLINYDSIRWFASQKIALKRRIVIYDESNYIKSHATARFKTLVRIEHMWLKYRYCLSATPAPNKDLAHLWSQYFVLDRGKRLGSNITCFRQSYCEAKSYPGLPVTLYKVKEEAKPKIHAAVADITYTLKAEDYLKMPPITYNNIYVTMPKKVADEYKLLEKTAVLEARNVASASAAVARMKLCQFVQGGIYDVKRKWHNIHTLKLTKLKELVEAADGDPILVLIQYRGELENIHKVFPGVPCITGSTLQSDTRTLLQEWNRGNIPLLCAHPSPIATGLNLQEGGHTIVWYNQFWSYYWFKQVNGRLYRQGQERPVVIHRILLKDTIDEALLLDSYEKHKEQENFLSYITAYLLNNRLLNG